MVMLIFAQGVLADAVCLLVVFSSFSAVRCDRASGFDSVRLHLFVFGHLCWCITRLCAHFQSNEEMIDVMIATTCCFQTPCQTKEKEEEE